jgi:hypothetical protein
LITSVVIRGESLRMRVPGEISLVAINPFPFPGIVSNFHSVSSELEESKPLDVVLAGELEGEVVLGAIWNWIKGV